MLSIAPVTSSNEGFYDSRSPSPVVMVIVSDNASDSGNPFAGTAGRFQDFVSPEIGSRSITPSSRNSSGDCLIANESNGTKNKNDAATGFLKKAFKLSSSGKNGLETNGLKYDPEIGNLQKGSDSSNMLATPSNYSDEISEQSGHEVQEESLFYTGLQVFIAFILAGFGNVAAGLILDKVQHWSSFVALSELFVLVPSLLGLKGNLEMTMAARLSTQANLGNMNNWRTIFRMAEGNLCLIQCQATVVAFFASMIAISGTVLRDGAEFRLNNALILCASSLITANIACFLLGVCMVGVITLSHRLHIDPDNVATPIAASLGDVTTLALLAAFAQLIYNQTRHETESFPALAVAIIVFFLAILPIWFYLAYANEYTRTVVTMGWTPVIIAMIISSAGGFILDYGANRYERIAMFQPVINGVGGNLVAVQASRLSTFLHRQGKPGQMPPGYKVFTTPLKAFFSNKNANVKTARILLLMAFPAHILYVIVIRLIKGGSDVELTGAFMSLYLVFALLQVALLLYCAYNLVFLLWKKGVDPDNYSIPILTAFGDFLGSAFLLFAFMFLSLLGDFNSYS